MLSRADPRSPRGLRVQQSCQRKVVDLRLSVAKQTSEGVDKEAFFDPADDKLYRHPTFYDIPNDVKNM